MTRETFLEQWRSNSKAIFELQQKNEQLIKDMIAANAQVSVGDKVEIIYNDHKFNTCATHAYIHSIGVHTPTTFSSKEYKSNGTIFYRFLGVKKDGSKSLHRLAERADIIDRIISIKKID